MPTPIILTVKKRDDKTSTNKKRQGQGTVAPVEDVPVIIAFSVTKPFTLAMYAIM
jgi:hypothetical protein